MTDRNERTLAVAAPGPGLDRLIEAASRRAVPAGRDADAVLREALIVGRARARAAARRRAVGSALGVGTALAAAVVLVIAVLPRASEVAAPSVTPDAPFAREPQPIALALPASHRALAMPASDVAVESTTESATVLRLMAGAALFDVTPLGASGAFVVRTPDATVHVRGTVFAVTVEAERTRVEVFEGRVEVRDARGTRLLEEHESYASDAALHTPGLLVARGELAARRRADAAALRGSASDPTSASARAPSSDSASAPAPASASSSVSAPSIVPARADAEPTVDLARLRAMCDRGEFAEALAAARSAPAPRAERGEWALVEGDAHRALGHVELAADAYERAASLLTPTRAALAGFLAATQHERAGDPMRALDILDRTHAAERGSPLEERALSMRAALLSRVGRREEARTAARSYLASYPGGEAIARMEALLAGPE